jgi:putative sigma-54 modulation protein
LFRKAHSHFKLNITSRHETLSEALTNQVEVKIHRVERFLGQITEAHVILTYERNLHLCEVTLTARHLKLSAKASSRDMYNSIDVALERLEKQAKKNKEKRVEHRHAPGAKAASVIHGLIPPVSDGEEFEVIRTQKHSIKPMTAEEAAMQLSASKDEFLVFLDADTDKTCVVYKRKDHHIGLIEPEY